VDQIKEALSWIADTGTNEWIKGLWQNNWIVITIVSAPVGAWLKGKHPEFWEKLSTILPFKGKTGRTL
jgi:hypothetical protein